MTDEQKFEELKNMIARGESEDEQTKMLTGYTKTELTAAFNLVQNKNDWKDRIDSYCTLEEMPIMTAAIEFFTATTPKFHKLVYGDNSRIQVFGRFKFGQIVMRVIALGYRAGPAGDH